MPQSLSKVIVHIVFQTKYGTMCIPTERLKGLHAYIAGVCRNHQAEAYRVGGIEDHVHIACRLPQTITIANLVEEIKKASSKWLKIGDTPIPDFRWQHGYGAFSISQSHLYRLIGYIENQAKHHETDSFENEYQLMVDKYSD